MFSSPPNIQEHSKYNKQIEIKMPRAKGIAGLFQAPGKPPVFRVPPLNAVIASKYGVPPPNQSKSFRGFQAGSNVDNISNIEFLNWTSIRKNTFDDPNKYRTEQLKNYEILSPINQDCCGACWAVSSTTAFADRYGIANDEKPIMPSIISVMSCCTKNKYKNIFRLVDTPDCDVMSSYEELENSPNSMGMCSGGIPYSAGLTIYRNGLPSDENTPYNPSLFQCNEIPSFPHMNKAIIDKYSCSEKLFDTNIRLRMDPDEKPTYISAHEGHPSSYVDLMKKALLEGGPLVGGYLVLGDQLAIGTDALGLGMDGGDKPYNWDSTGKVYVPGAYNNEWNNVILSSVGGSTTLEIDDSNIDEPSQVYDKGLKPREAIGRIFCGFHAIVIVGWGELDMDYVPNKNIKTIKGKDGRNKLPFWICRNSWGNTWPINDYYKGGIKVLANGKEQTLQIPPGYWLHAMYPNESMGIDVPINYQGTYYGATMVMTPKKISTPDKSNEVSMECNTTWMDSEGYSCKQYGDYNWCTTSGNIGPGWNAKWGNFSNFKNNGKDATEICCECGAGNSQSTKAQSNQITLTGKDTIVSFIIGVYYALIGISIIGFIILYFKKK